MTRRFPHRTQCRRGHLWTEWQHLTKDGRQVCIACRRLLEQARYRQNKKRLARAGPMEAA